MNYWLIISKSIGQKKNEQNSLVSNYTRIFLHTTDVPDRTSHYNLKKIPQSLFYKKNETKWKK